MEKIKLLFTCLLILSSFYSFSLEDNKDTTDNNKIKITGYIQTQMEVCGKDGKTKTGGLTSYSEDRDKMSDDWFLRYGIRRGRVRTQYIRGKVKGQVEIDINENGLTTKNAFIQATFSPYINAKIGLLTIFFGDEVCYPSALIETLEKSLATQKLFPDEKDFAFQLTMKGKQKTVLDGFTWDVGLTSGNSVHKDNDGNMNLLTHLKYNHSFNNLSFGLGASWYEGSTNNADTLVYKVENHSWQPEITDRNHRNTRRYIGFDAQISLNTDFGKTNLRGEYIFGKQPSMETDIKSPNNNEYTDYFSYQRDFSSSYLYLIQQINNKPLFVVFKYSFFNPNTKINDNEIRNKGDIKYTNYGIGCYYDFKYGIKLACFYDFFQNEKTNSLPSYNKDLKDNLLTLRLQYQF
jgi:hypothetical protein